MVLCSYGPTKYLPELSCWSNVVVTDWMTRTLCICRFKHIELDFANGSWLTIILPTSYDAQTSKVYCLAVTNKCDHFGRHIIGRAVQGVGPYVSNWTILCNLWCLWARFLVWNFGTPDPKREGILRPTLYEKTKLFQRLNFSNIYVCGYYEFDNFRIIPKWLFTLPEFI